MFAPSLPFGPPFTLVSYSPCTCPQAKELLDHLEGVLSNKPVEIVGGQGYVEIKPQGVSKGRALERLLAAACASTGTLRASSASGHVHHPLLSHHNPHHQPPRPGVSSAGMGSELLGSSPPSEGSSSLTANGLGGPDFMLCIGDDRSDEDMYTSIETMKSSPTMTAEVRE